MSVATDEVTLRDQVTRGAIAGLASGVAMGLALLAMILLFQTASSVAVLMVIWLAVMVTGVAGGALVARRLGVHRWVAFTGLTVVGFALVTQLPVAEFLRGLGIGNSMVATALVLIVVPPLVAVPAAIVARFSDHLLR